MNSIKSCLLFFIILSLSYSCTNNLNIENKLLAKSESILNQYPDSALTLLEAIKETETNNLSESQFNKLNLLLTKAKDKCYQNISNDTIIFRVFDYYKNKEEPFYSASSSFYCGRVYEERKDTKQALLAYLDAEKYASCLNGQDTLKGLIQSHIGDLFLEDLLMDNAILHYHKAINHFKLSGRYENEAITYNQIGVCYLMKDTDPDSTTFYFQKSLDIADKSKNKYLQMINRHNLGLVWASIGELDQSIDYLNDALRFSVSNKDSIQIYFNKARIYQDAHENDSAYSYIEKASSLLTDGSNYYLRKNLNQLKSRMYKRRGEYQKALNLYEDYTEYLEREYNIHKNKDFLDIQKKYNYELMKNEHNEVLIFRHRLIISLLIAILAAVILGAIFLRRAIRNKHALARAEELIGTFKELVVEVNMKNDSMKSTLLQHFDILKKAALVDSYMKEKDRDSGSKVLNKFNEIIFGQRKLDWDVLFNTMNTISNGQLKILHITYPQLEDIEFKICCLVYSDFSNTEISLLLNLSVSAIRYRRSCIRKKLGIEEYGNIAGFIKENVEKSPLSS